jgi:hypothetical protein
VTRNLAVVTAAFAEYLDDLPGRLTVEYDCVVREADQGELELIARDSSEGGTSAVVGLGRAVDIMVPQCLCDACDEDSESSMAELNELGEVVTPGFRRVMVFR